MTIEACEPKIVDREHSWFQERAEQRRHDAVLRFVRYYSYDVPLRTEIPRVIRLNEPRACEPCETPIQYVFSNDRIERDAGLRPAKPGAHLELRRAIL